VKLIKLEQESLNKEWNMQFMDKEHFDVCVNEDAHIQRPDGSTLLIMIKNPFSKAALETARPILKKIRQRTENRSTASGIKAEARTKLDGTKSSTTRVPKGWEVMSGLIGYFERSVRFPYCHACAWNQEHPELFAKLIPFLTEANQVYKQHTPERWAVQTEHAQKCSQDFVIPGTNYTTVTVNHNFRTACHLDAGDLKTGFSNLICLREGNYRGAELVLPNWRVSVDLHDGDMIIFDPHEWHGNCQILPLTKNALRTTIVCYFRELMQYCKSTTEEIDFAKNRKAGDVLFPERQ